MRCPGCGFDFCPCRELSGPGCHPRGGYPGPGRRPCGYGTKTERAQPPANPAVKGVPAITDIDHAFRDREETSLHLRRRQFGKRLKASHCSGAGQTVTIDCLGNGLGKRARPRDVGLLS